LLLSRHSRRFRRWHREWLVTALSVGARRRLYCFSGARVSDVSENRLGSSGPLPMIVNVNALKRRDHVSERNSVIQLAVAMCRIQNHIVH
jgi:hypothetical protein